QVYMAKETGTNEIVALKKIRMDNEREGFPITAIREIKILKKLHHQNVIKLKEIVTSPGPERDEQGRSIDDNKYKGSIYIVFEYMDHDLTGLADRPGMRFTVPQIKCYMKQLLTGLHYCHVNQVLHRDIKGSNLLIDNEGNLKLADFGLARSFSSDHNGNLTNRVITLWYRYCLFSLLLLGSTKYNPAVDMWSVGCIFAELLNGKPILPGKNELTKIFELCGTPDDTIWPGVTKMPWYNNFKPHRPLKRRVKDFFKHFDRHALDLLEKIFHFFKIIQRISAKDTNKTSESYAYQRGKRSFFFKFSLVQHIQGMFLWQLIMLPLCCIGDGTSEQGGRLEEPEQGPRLIYTGIKMNTHAMHSDIARFYGYRGRRKEHISDKTLFNMDNAGIIHIN
ncbi:hypothetical protein ACJX0J_013994, partial [Zea mays]